MKFRQRDKRYLDVYRCKDRHIWGVNIVIDDKPCGFAQMWFTPARVRKIAAALVKAADEAEKP